MDPIQENGSNSTKYPGFIARLTGQCWVEKCLDKSDLSNLTSWLALPTLITGPRTKFLNFKTLKLIPINEFGKKWTILRRNPCPPFIS